VKKGKGEEVREAELQVGLPINETKGSNSTERAAYY